MDCYGWLIAPFQLLICTQKQQAEAKIMDLTLCDHKCVLEGGGKHACVFVSACADLYESV